MSDPEKWPRPTKRIRLTEAALNLAGALVSEAAAVAAGEESLSGDEVAARLETCTSCAHFLAEASKCSLCGCYMKVKTHFRSQHCPVGKW
jgi:hypothetical protein